MTQLGRVESTVVFSDDVIGQHPDRQVFVIGDTVVGHTLALLLHRAGFDPLLATASGASVESDVVSFSPSAQRVLEFIDVDLSALEYTSINRISVHSANTSTKNATEWSQFGQAEQERLVVVSTRELHGVLKDMSAERLRNTDRRIETVSYRDDGLVVEFADGIREWFDLVIYADGLDAVDQNREQTPVDTTLLTQHEVSIDDENLPGEDTRCLERWNQDTHLQALPQQRGNRLLRVTAPQETPTDQIARELDNQLLFDERTTLKTKLSEVEPSTVRQTVLEGRNIDSDWWGDGRICRCGQAAYPTAPATGIRISSGIEDALAFVSELARGDRPSTDVVTAYANHRAQHLISLVRTGRLIRSEDDYLDLIPSGSPLETVGLLRRVTLAPLFDDKFRSVQQDWFDSS